MPNARSYFTRPLSIALPTLALLLAACGEEEPLPPDGGVLYGPHEATIDGLVAPLLEDEWTVGMVVGLLLPDGSTAVYGYGSAVRDGFVLPNRSTLYEIGSISKTFTGLALASMAEEGSVQLDQTVQSLLPAGQVTVPSLNNVDVTLAHLSTHTSGMPRMPPDFAPSNPDDPYPDYGTAELYTTLNGLSLTAEPGTAWEYSNLGVGLLGHALALTDGSSYEEMIDARICTPLGLTDTGMTLSADQQVRYAQGYTGDLGEAAPFTFDALAGAGALRSTADDVLTYLAAQAGVVSSPLSTAMQQSHTVRYSVSPSMDIGLGWLIDEDRYTWHNGGTYGFGTYAGFDPQTQTGVTVLSNVFTAYGAETRLGREVLKLVAGESYVAPDLPATLVLDVSELQPYAGNFRIGSVSSVDVEFDGQALYLVLPGQPRLRMFASDVDSFYLRMAVATITYDCSGSACDSFFFDQPGAGSFTATRQP